MKRCLRHLLPLVLLLATTAGCSSTVTNLTPRQLPRNADGLYRFEASWRSRQQTLRKETLRAFVVIGTELYPMQPTPIVSNHWETLVPIPSEKDIVNYRYKFDFDYNAVPERRPNSRLSRPYQLRLLD